jgi:hypothetical protein
MRRFWHIAVCVGALMTALAGLWGPSGSACAQTPPRGETAPVAAPDAPPPARGTDVEYTWRERIGVHSNPTRTTDLLSVSSTYIEHGLEVTARPRDRENDRASLTAGIAYRDFLEADTDFDSVEASLAGLLGMRARDVAVDATLGGTRTSEAIDVQGVSTERLRRDSIHAGLRMGISFREVDLATTATRTRLLYDRGDLRALNHAREDLAFTAAFETSRLTSWTMGITFGRVLFDESIQNDGELTTYAIGQRVKSAETASWSWDVGVTTIRTKPTATQGVPLSASATVGVGGLEWETAASRTWRVGMGVRIGVDLAQGNGFRRNAEVNATSSWDIGKDYKLSAKVSQQRSKPSTSGAIIVRRAGADFIWRLSPDAKLEIGYALDQRTADGSILDYTATIATVAFALVF